MAPANLAAIVFSANKVNLAWTDNSNNEDGFKVERKTGAGGTYALVITTSPNTVTSQNTGLTNKTTYYYRVYAYNTGGNSSYSNEVSATTFAINLPQTGQTSCWDEAGNPILTLPRSDVHTGKLMC